MSPTDLSPPTSEPAASWHQGALIELVIANLSPTGDGVGRWGEDQRVVFVPDTVPGDRISARLVRVKPKYANAQLQELLEPSTYRIRPHCIVADKCGGCQWQPVDYTYQISAKQDQVVQALGRIGKFQDPPVDEILAAPSPLGYRNKVTYPLTNRRSHGEKKVQAGYYRKGSHRLVNLNQCPVQDPHLDPLLAAIKQDIQDLEWPVYNEKTHEGIIRHLSMRVGRRTEEILITLVVCNDDIPVLGAQAAAWMRDHPGIVGVCLNINSERTNRIFGKRTDCIVGRPYLVEEFAGLQFHIRANTFFQIHTEQAEALLEVILAELNLQGHETVLDAYCGIGTLSLPIARHAAQVVGLEVQEEAVKSAIANAALNNITNVTFQTGKVERLLSVQDDTPDIVLVDPPRKGCSEAVVEQLLELKAPRLVYMSCNPATLARDLKFLCQGGDYQLTRVQPADFFPQTAHVECVAFLERQSPT
ncbi:23S rRNA (uracil(1939)-C(5))-methyltransferase RlmD [Acaryochloris thomasi]|uniref:23S rRNA (uracil(1939)-C(5))-methyltransferase RlmD n=1 Tax=Acaryochloris thomasi TaxID=2929456 RepID=UPI000DA697CF|nr:23S rRNA (uracil(1939)-C(5))-methyltransferase RlmD [Acaryochloris thomasi]